METLEAALGRGGLRLRVSEDEVMHMRIEIHSNGVFCAPLGSDTLENLFTFIDGLDDSASIELAGGHVLLSALPSAPRDAFYNVTMAQAADAVTLHVLHADPFARQSNLHFQNLELSIVQTADSLSVNGSVNAVLFGESIPLNAVLDAENKLMFEAAGTIPDIEIDQVGTLQLSTLALNPTETNWAGLQALYAFDEGDGLTVHDSSGSANPHDLTIGTTNGEASELDFFEWEGDGFLKWQFRSADDSSEDGSPPEQQIFNHHAIMQAAESSVPLSNRLLETQEFSIAAWVRPSQTMQGGPARIVTLSEDFSERAFSLCHGLNGGTQADVYNVRVRTTGTSQNGIPSLTTHEGAVIQDDISHVVYTCSEDGRVAIYINGILQETVFRDMGTAVVASPTGEFNWDLQAGLALGNELVGGRAWQGDYHRVEIYDRALTEQEVTDRYRPDVVIEGTLQIANLPAPLDVPFDAILTLQPFRTEIHVQHGDLAESPVENALEVRPHFSFTGLDALWQKEDGDEWVFTGEATGVLWRSPVEFDVLSLDTDEGQHLAFFLRTNPVEVDSLGALTFEQLAVVPAGPPDDLSWVFEADGVMHFNHILPAFSGPSFPSIIIQDRLQLILDHLEGNRFYVARQLDMHSEDAEGSLAFVFGPAEVPQEEGSWVVTSWSELPTDSSDPSRLLATSRIAFPGIPDFVPAPDSPVTLYSGKWAVENRVDLDIKMAFVQDGDLFGHGFELSGTVSQDGGNEVTLSASGHFVFPDDSDGAVQLEGTSEITSLDTTLFTGDIKQQGSSFVLNGSVSLFPDWSATQVFAIQEIRILNGGVVSIENMEEVTVDDFVLLDPDLQLASDEGELTLKGRWLGEELTLVGAEQDVTDDVLDLGDGTADPVAESQTVEGLVLQGDVEFLLPFNGFEVEVGPFFDPLTGVQVADVDRVCQTPGCMRIMKTKLHVELTTGGFMARILEATFRWQDKTGTINKHIELPESTLFAAPPTRNALLEHLLTELETHADEIIGEQLRHDSEFVFDEGDATIMLQVIGGASTDPIEITLPAIFESDVSLTPSSGDTTCTIMQSGPSTTVSISAGGSAAEMKDVFDQLWGTKDTAGTVAGFDLKPGAARLLRTRMAQRLPIPVSDVLYYYHGFNKEHNFIDLAPGMRLRVEYQNYQLVLPNSQTAEDGFVGSGVNHYYVNPYIHDGNHVLGLDTFLNGMVIASEVSAEDSGAGNVLDLQQPDFRRAYIRLVYPTNPSDAKGSPERVPAIICADNLLALQQATQKWIAEGITDTSGATSYFFRGRATIVPEINVFVQEQPVYVPLGTTVRNLIDRYADIPLPGLGDDLSQFQGTTRPRRLVQNGINSEPTYRFINFDTYKTFGVNNDHDVYDLPVLKGDRFYF